MLKKITGLLTDSATYGISKFLAQIIGFFLLPLYTRYLTPADFGLIAMLAILAAVFSPLAGLGMTNAIFRRYNLSKDETERKRVLGVGLSSVLVTSLMLLVAALFFSTSLSVLLSGDPDNQWLVTLTLITAAINTVGEIPRAILRARRQVRTVAVLNTIDVAIAIGLTIFFVVGLHRGVQGIVEANLIANVQSLILNIFVNLRGTLLNFERNTWLAMLKYGLPFVPHRFLAFGMAQYGQYLTGSQLGLEQAGLYSLALRVTAPISFIVGAIQQAWVPYKFQIHAESSQSADFFRSFTTYYVAATCYLWVGVSVWGPEVIRLMTTSGFHNALRLIPVVAFIPVAQGYYFIFGTGIELSDNTKPMPLISFLGLASVVLSSIWSVTNLGAFGAAISTIIGWLVMAGVAYYFAQRRYKISYDWWIILLILTFSVACIWLSSIIESLNLLYRLRIGLSISVIFPVVVIFSLFLSPFERERVHILFRKMIPTKFFIKKRSN